MLRNLEELHGYSIGAVDGEVGRVKDLFLDDQAWVVRYLVVDTGSWLSGRQVLISPMAIGEPNWAARLLPVSITKAQVKNSPEVDTQQPVTRQHELDYSGYYGYPSYWGGDGFWGGGMYPGPMLVGYGGFGSPEAIREESQNAQARSDQARAAVEARDASADAHLRSCKAITGYHIQATDGEIGHVCGLLIDDETWAVRYLIVDTSNWWVGHQMLVATQWIEDVSWSHSTVSVKLSRQAVKEAPPFEPTGALTREDEARLHEHYGRSGYWGPQDKRLAEATRA